jgi:hypothetical protein
MKTVKRLTLVTTLLLGAAPAALAQNAQTSATINNRLAAGYPSPYGTESDLYDYAPGTAVRQGERRQSRLWSTSTPKYESGLSAYGYVSSSSLDADSNSPALAGGGSLGYNIQMSIQ